jgi:uncharacterized protein (TIGR02996 family)
MAASLLAQIHAEPDELSHRSVYADFLAALGDPLGEFIALQLAEHRGQADAHARRQARALAKAHGQTWLGPLGAVLTKADTVFERGFVTRGRVHPRARELHLDAPQWATIETLSRAPLALATSPGLRSLRDLRVGDAVAHGLLVDEEPRPKLERLDIDFDRYRGGWVGPGLGLSRRYQELLEDAILANEDDRVLLPNLRELGLVFRFPVEREHLAWVWRGPLARHLETIRVDIEPEQYLALDEWIEGLRADRAATPRALVLSQAGFEYRLDPGEDRSWARMRVSGYGREPALVEGLESLRECEVAEVEIAETLRRRARGSLARLIEGLC